MGKSPKEIATYEHSDELRTNNPEAGAAKPANDPRGQSNRYQYDPHIDPTLQWAGKAERTSFAVPRVSLHVHERIDPMLIISQLKKEGFGGNQSSLFSDESAGGWQADSEALDFYKHERGWANRLIAGDSLLVMNSLMEKESLGGKVQMIYIDPPYGIKYGSNFQPFTNQRSVKHGDDKDLTTEPEVIQAYRDTWELETHSYLTYMRDRLLLAKDMLTESGSIFVQINAENLAHIREIMDEVFENKNFVNMIFYRTKSNSQQGDVLTKMGDYIVWYAKDKKQVKYNELFSPKNISDDAKKEFNHIYANGESRRLTSEEINDANFLNENAKSIFRLQSIVSQRKSKNDFSFKLNGETYKPSSGLGWVFDNTEELNRLVSAGRFAEMKATNRLYRQFWSDFPYYVLNNAWFDVMAELRKSYAVQTSVKIIQRCMLMTTDPGDLVFDPTCGSGTTAYVAEQWGRRWVTCDTSRVATTLARQRLLTAKYDYYRLADEQAGVKAGFIYTEVPHVTLRSIARDEPLQVEKLYDDPKVDNSKVRITGPFTMEAVPSATVKSPDELIEAGDAAQSESDSQLDVYPARSDDTQFQAEWCDELRSAGVRAKSGELLEFSSVELLEGSQYLHAEAKTRETKSRRVLICFGPAHAPLDKFRFTKAYQEAEIIEPDLLLFCSLQFDAEVTKNIAKVSKIVGIQLLQVQMNADLLTGDLKKKRTSNESFWLVGQPDVELKRLTGGQYQVAVHGFDYYNPRTGDIDSGNTRNIAMWLLDTDYNGRSLLPSQVFFPLSGARDGWSKLARNLKAELDADKLEAYRGTSSLPFKLGGYERVAVKIVDTRGIESLRVLDLADVG